MCADRSPPPLASPWAEMQLGRERNPNLTGTPRPPVGRRQPLGRNDATSRAVGPAKWHGRPDWPLTVRAAAAPPKPAFRPTRCERGSLQLVPAVPWVASRYTPIQGGIRGHFRQTEWELVPLHE